jgi:3-phenylpropionate/trans-cinnamate dioxygenase subunit alpha
VLGGGRSALRAPWIGVLQPKGPLNTEMWQWAFMPKDAPRAVREMAFAQFGKGGHFGPSFFAQDDAENFERVTENTVGYIARQVPFDLTMGLGYEGRWPGQEAWDVAGLPGLVGPRFSEHSQRNFYARWAALMSGEGDGQP